MINKELNTLKVIIIVSTINTFMIIIHGIIILLNEVLKSLLFQLNEIDMKNGREMVTSQKTRNLSNLEKKVKSGVTKHDDCYDQMIMTMTLKMIASRHKRANTRPT